MSIPRTSEGQCLFSLLVDATLPSFLARWTPLETPDSLVPDEQKS